MSPQSVCLSLNAGVVLTLHLHQQHAVGPQDEALVQAWVFVFFDTLEAFTHRTSNE